MALSGTEQRRGGFIVDTSTEPPMLVVTTATSGAAWSGGFLRDPDGRLVVTYG